MISAIILAAGKSSRMGQPKMLLPWGDGTVLSHVVSVFKNAGVDDIVVVTGETNEYVAGSLENLNTRTVFNIEHSTGEMLSSIHCGIRAMGNETDAALIGLGDQPQVQDGSVRKICELFSRSESNIVVPSYQMRRGHPWLVGRPLWEDLLSFKHPKTPRDFLQAHAHEIIYAELNDPNILADIDTPEEYKRWHK